MNCELHHGGNALANIANLHVAGAISNCRYYEVVINDRSGAFGVLNPPEVGTDGTVRVPLEPGLGVQIDVELLNHHTLEQLN
jgi:L-alanine-DL-glutamate epimerase-like enolase superfamily enzyme